MRIIGIDPGSRVCGWGVIEETTDASCIAHVDCGIVAPKADAPLGLRLQVIYKGLTEVIEKYKPEQAAMESLFYAKNARSALVLGHARGVAMLALGHADLEIFEYAPANIKQAVCGYGRAPKEQVSRMVMAILGLPEVAQADASDALACAICHRNSYRLARAIKAGCSR